MTFIIFGSCESLLTKIGVALVDRCSRLVVIMTPPLTAKEKKERKAAADAAKLAKAAAAALALEEAIASGSSSPGGRGRRGESKISFFVLSSLGNSIRVVRIFGFYVWQS